MIRFCIASANPIEIHRNADAKWSVEGIAAEFYLDGMILAERSYPFLNVTFYLTTSTDECLERLAKNQSDSTSVFMPIESISPDYYVPHPLIAGKLAFVTGYNMTDGDRKVEDTATVATNLELLHAEVYIWALMLIVSFIMFIITRISVLSSPFQRINPRAFIKVVRREVCRVFYHVSVYFKLITLLYSVLCFFILTSFLCLYKTSHVIIEKPFYVKSYQESLEHKTSLAFQYNQFANVTRIFENSPKESLRGKLWAKLVASGRKDDYSAIASNPERMPFLLDKGANELNVRKSICVAAPLISPLLKSIACGFSPQNELWIAKIISDASESEVIYGHAIRAESPYKKLNAARLQLFFETNIIAHNFELGLDQSAAMAELKGTNKKHQWRQKVVCENENAFALDPEVRAIPLLYFHSFFEACVAVWLFAFIFNFMQIFCNKAATYRVSRRSVTLMK